MSVQDGHLERSARTRQAMIEAYLEIVSLTGREPMVAEITKLARCSTRTLFERFGTLGALGVAAFQEVLRRHVPAPADDWLHRDRADRIRFQVTVRARNCEAWSKLWRLVVKHEGESDRFDQCLEAARGLTRRRLELMYRPELDTLAAARRLSLLIALEAVVDYAAWDRLRETHSIEEGIEAWIETIDRMLPPTPT